MTTANRTVDGSAPTQCRCSFCETPEQDGSLLVAGPGVWICGRCITVATVAVVESHAPGWGTLPPDRGNAQRKLTGAGRCSFCGRRRAQVDDLARGPGVEICSRCLETCNVIALRR